MKTKIDRLILRQRLASRPQKFLFLSSGGQVNNAENVFSTNKLGCLCSELGLGPGVSRVCESFIFGNFPSFRFNSKGSSRFYAFRFLRPLMTKNFPEMERYWYLYLIQR